MLLSQNGGGHQVNYLLVLLHCFKRRPDGHLSLTKAYVAAHQPVHDLITFHILFGSRNGCQLVFCFLIRKQFFKFLLPYRIRPITEALPPLSGCIQLHQIPCHILYGRPDSGFGLTPFRTAQFGQFGFLCLCICIFLDQMKLGCRNKQIASISVLDPHKIPDGLFYFHLLNATVNAQTVVFMDYIISWCQLLKTLDLGTLKLILAVIFMLFLLPSKQIFLCQYRKSGLRVGKSPMQRSISHQDFSRLDISSIFLRIKCPQFIRTKCRRQTLPTKPGSAQHDHTILLFLIGLQFMDQQIHITLIGIDPLHHQGKHLSDLHHTDMLFQTGDCHCTGTIQLYCYRLEGTQNLCLTGQHIALFQTMAHALPKFCFHFLSPFFHPLRFIQKDQGLFQRQIVQNTRWLLIKIRHTAFQTGHTQPFL